ncbi:MAG: tRNA 4-thiouridine(8) synthase ThiI [Thermoprotei archaeon]|nr:MAG: tRNA 4-thiouridine(8) synthase ThiI [Thermoprotei archaeon]
MIMNDRELKRYFNVARNVIIVGYGEITLKSHKVRLRMERTLIDNMIRQLKKEGIKVREINKEGGRIFICTDNDEKAVKVLTKVFGIVFVARSLEVTLDMEEIEKEVRRYSKDVLANVKTFAIRAHRANKKFPVNSMEIARILGKAILDENKHLKVNLENPEREIFIEIRQRGAYVYHEKHKGPGGLPYGVEGKIIALMSGGMDSTIAAWMMMKRGCRIVPVHYDLSPYVNEKARERIINVLKWLKEWIPDKEIRAIVIPLSIAHERTMGVIDERYRCLFCKTMMYLVAQEIAREVGAKAIVTGESLGQVASQTLDNLYVLSRRVEIPILRPLIGYDKGEIIEMARKLGVYEISSIKVTCNLVPTHPETHCREENFLAELNKIDLKRTIEELMNKRRIIRI